jgi:hypothetical protein
MFTSNCSLKKAEESYDIIGLSGSGKEQKNEIGEI